MWHSSSSIRNVFPTTAIFVTLAVLVFIGSLIFSTVAKFNPLSTQKNVHWSEFIYSIDDTREMLTNTCKLPYTFLTNDDVIDGDDNFRNECPSRELNDHIVLSLTEGVLTLTGEVKQEMGSTKFFDPIKCSYFKPNDISNRSELLEVGKSVKVLYYNFAVSCKRDGIAEFIKPLINFAVIPKEVRGESVAVLFLPTINHKLFMKLMTKSKIFMLENHFLFSKMTVMKEARPLQDLLLQLGSSNKLNVFQKAKQQNFTTFFSGPQQIRDLFEVDYDTTTHRNFVFQDLIDDKKCLEDGRRFVDDQLERFKGFLTATKGFKFFSTIFLDDYGVRKKAIDLDLNETLTNLESNGIFQNTTLIITSYNLSDKELTGADEDDKNPFLAVRLSDEWKKRYPQKFDFLNMNFNRLVLSSNTYELIMNLLEPNSTSSESPWFTALSIFRTCSDLGISKNTCLCMNTNTVSEFDPSLEIRFLTEIRNNFMKEVKRSNCVKSVDIKPQPLFYSYSNKIKGDVRVVELSADVTMVGPFGQKVLPVKKTFTFEPMFKSYKSFDTARVQINYGVNIGIDGLCYL